MTVVATPQPSKDAGKPYDQFILFGDSITQMSYKQEIGFGFGAQLQEGRLTVLAQFFQHADPSSVYARKLDVINRGFS
jgi:hypothetical protein